MEKAFQRNNSLVGHISKPLCWFLVLNIVQVFLFYYYFFFACNIPFKLGYAMMGFMDSYNRKVMDFSMAGSRCLNCDIGM